jgi:hypothetical protein
MRSATSFGILAALAAPTALACTCGNMIHHPVSGSYTVKTDTVSCVDSTSACTSATFESSSELGTSESRFKIVMPGGNTVVYFLTSGVLERSFAWVYSPWTSSCKSVTLDQATALFPPGISTNTLSWPPEAYTLGNGPKCGCAPAPDTVCIAGSGPDGQMSGASNSSLSSNIGEYFKSQPFAINTVFTSNEGLPQMFCNAQQNSTDGKFGPGTGYRYTYDHRPVTVDIPSECPNVPGA